MPNGSIRFNLLTLKFKGRWMVVLEATDVRSTKVLRAKKLLLLGTILGPAHLELSG